MSIPALRELAAQLRVDSIRCSTRAGSGHPTSSLSAADLMAVLLRDFLRWDLARPDHPNNDHLVFSKGHASPLLYSMLRATGAISEDELFSYRRLGSRLQGHPVPVLPWVDVATGSLGQGLPIAVGLALAAKYLEDLPYRVWVLLGDSEMSEGSIWEAFDHARCAHLAGLVAILDMNRLGQRGPTPLGWDSAAYAARARAFGWRAIEVDGHDLEAVTGAYTRASSEAEAPTLIVARTVKGKGVSFLEDRNGWHGKVLDEAQCAAALAELGGVRDLRIEPERPANVAPAPRPAPAPLELPRYTPGERLATRKAYGAALAAVGAARPEIVALDAEVSNSTYAKTFAERLPAHFFEMYISEQQMVAAAVGLAARGRVPFASTFGAFFTRAYDFVRMAAISRSKLRLCGSHAGVSIGADGPSQMALEDLAMMRAVQGSAVLYPCCANQTAKLVRAMTDYPGIVYLRTTRDDTPVLYPPEEDFAIGGSRTLRASDHDRVTILTAGITVHEALDAASRLARDGVAVRVLDAYSVKPLDVAGICRAVAATDGRAVVVEDHLPEGGLGEAVLASLSGLEPLSARIVHLAVTSMPGSGTGAELRHAAGIDAEAIVVAVHELLGDEAEIEEEERTCFVCGAPASWRILIAGEDEDLREEEACEEHAGGHRHLARLRPPLPRAAPRPQARH
jgi:transketolase